MDIVAPGGGALPAGSPFAIFLAAALGAWSYSPTAPPCPAHPVCHSCPVVTTAACPAAVACGVCEAVEAPTSNYWWLIGASWIVGTVGVQHLLDYFVATATAWYEARKSSGGKTPPVTLRQRAALEDGERDSAGLGMGPVQRRRNVVAPATRHRPTGTYSRG